jgi:hypothetical protein
LLLISISLAIDILMALIVSSVNLAVLIAVA